MGNISNLRENFFVLPIITSKIKSVLNIDLQATVYFIFYSIFKKKLQMNGITLTGG